MNNYGVRIDYIVCDGLGSKEHLVECQHRPEIESSDHCPVVAQFDFVFSDRSQGKPPMICTKFWSEFKGTQMKLSQFVVKTKRTHEEVDVIVERSVGSPSSSRNKPPLKKVKSGQSSLLQHFKRRIQPPNTHHGSSLAKEAEATVSSTDSTTEKSTWGQIFRPPTPPPLCTGHRERCVIRQVKDAASANWGRYFFVCSRANGASDNPQARCDHFQWKELKKKTTT